MHVVLVHPEIAPNTGNIIRLCANAGVDLHLVEPLGFSLDDRLLKRGGLDYHELASVTVHADLGDLVDSLPGRRFTFGSRHQRRYDEVAYEPSDVLLFGAERAGLPADVAASVPDEQQLTIPMRPGNRSLNLANAVGIVVYEAWRQMGFSGSADGQLKNGAAAPLTSETPGAPGFDR